MSVLARTCLLASLFGTGVLLPASSRAATPFRDVELAAVARTHAAFDQAVRQLAPAYYKRAEKFTAYDGRTLALVGKPKWAGVKVGVDPTGNLFRVTDFQSEIEGRIIRHIDRLEGSAAYALSEHLPGNRPVTLPMVVRFFERSVAGDKARAGSDRLRRILRVQVAATRRRMNDEALRQKLEYYKVDPALALQEGVTERIIDRGEVVIAERRPSELGWLGPGSYIPFEQKDAHKAQLVLSAEGNLVLKFDQRDGRRTRYPFDLSSYDVERLFPNMSIKAALEAALK